MKKIIMAAGPVHTCPPLKGAAVETWMYEVSKRIVNFEPHIISISHPFYPLREYRDSIFFHRIRFSNCYKRLFQKITKLDPFSYPKRMAKIIDKVQPEIVHMHNSVSCFLPLIKTISPKGIKTVLHMQNEVNVPIELKVDAFIGCSNFIVDSYKNTMVKATNYSCIYNGVYIERFRPYWEVNSLRKGLRKKLDIKPDDFVALFVGRISPEKGVEHFIKAASILKDKNQLRFFVIGEIPEGGKNNKRASYAKEMLEMAAPLGNKVIFTDGFPPSKIHLLYLLGDVLITPSNFEEPFSMTTIEAMATGLPIIARKKGGLKEYLVDKENGIFINENRLAEDIAEKIVHLMSDKHTRKTLGEAARKTVEERFSWDRIASEVETLYSELIKVT